MGSNGVKSKRLTLSLLACVQQPYREWIVFDESAAPPQHNPARGKVRQSPAAIDLIFSGHSFPIPSSYTVASKCSAAISFPPSRVHLPVCSLTRLSLDRVKIT